MSRIAKEPRIAEQMARLVGIMETLRAPGGCPWDRSQTHESLVQYCLEEAYEVVDAIERDDSTDLLEELGDLLLQVVFHAQIASEDGGEGFDFADVARGIGDKLVFRHPHVFGAGDLEELGPEDVNARWDAIKATEKQRSSVLDGIPLGQSGLARTQKVIARAQRRGLEVDPPRETDEDDAERTVGLELFHLIRQAGDHGVEVEAALRAVTKEYEEAIRVAETRSGESHKNKQSKAARR